MKEREREVLLFPSSSLSFSFSLYVFLLLSLSFSLSPFLLLFLFLLLFFYLFLSPHLNHSLLFSHCLSLFILPLSLRFSSPLFTLFSPFLSTGEQHGFRQSANIRRALDTEFYFFSRVFHFEPAEDFSHPLTIVNEEALKL